MRLNIAKSSKSATFSRFRPLPEILTPWLGADILMLSHLDPRLSHLPSRGLKGVNVQSSQNFNRARGHCCCWWWLRYARLVSAASRQFWAQLSSQMVTSLMLLTSWLWLIVTGGDTMQTWSHSLSPLSIAQTLLSEYEGRFNRTITTN